MHIIKICTGCSCARNFAEENVKKAEELLGIKVGEQSADGKFKLEKTGCLSNCEKGPNVMFCKTDGPLGAVMMDGKVENNMLPHRLQKKLEELMDNN